MTRVEKSWAKFKKHFTAVDIDRVNNKTLQDTSYHNTNDATADTNTVTTFETTDSEDTGISTISALTEAISLQTTANQANFTKMLEILEKSGNKFSTSRTGPRNGRQLSYCWTHSRSDNTAHIGATCMIKKDDHLDEVTWSNKWVVMKKKIAKKSDDLRLYISRLLPNNSKRIKLKITSTANNVSNVNVDALHATSPLIAVTVATGYFDEMNASFL